jgi:hypothetical protein
LVFPTPHLNYFGFIYSHSISTCRFSWNYGLHFLEHCIVGKILFCAKIVLRKEIFPTRNSSNVYIIYTALSGEEIQILPRLCQPRKLYIWTPCPSKFDYLCKTLPNNNHCTAEAGTITFILISDHILDHCSKIDLRSYQESRSHCSSKI